MSVAIVIDIACTRARSAAIVNNTRAPAVRAVA
jgi:hypothetical protein